MVTTESLQLINRANDETRPLDDTQIQIESIEGLAYATKVARCLRIAVKDMCPSCVGILQKALGEEEQENKINDN